MSSRKSNSKKQQITSVDEHADVEQLEQQLDSETEVEQSVEQPVETVVEDISSNLIEMVHPMHYTRFLL